MSPKRQTRRWRTRKRPHPAADAPTIDEVQSRGESRLDASRFDLDTMWDQKLFDLWQRRQFVQTHRPHLPPPANGAVHRQLVDVAPGNRTATPPRLRWEPPPQWIRSSILRLTCGSPETLIVRRDARRATKKSPRLRIDATSSAAASTGATSTTGSKLNARCDQASKAGRVAGVTGSVALPTRPSTP